MFLVKVDVGECDGCQVVAIGEEEALVKAGWSVDDRDSAFCPTCSRSRGLTTEAEVTEEEAEAMAKAITEDPAVVALAREKDIQIKGWELRIKALQTKKAFLAKQKGKKKELAPHESDLLQKDAELREAGVFEHFIELQAKEAIRRRQEHDAAVAKRLEEISKAPAVAHAPGEE